MQQSLFVAPIASFSSQTVWPSLASTGLSVPKFILFFLSYSVEMNCFHELYNFNC